MNRIMGLTGTGFIHLVSLADRFDWLTGSTLEVYLEAVPVINVDHWGPTCQYCPTHQFPISVVNVW
jgi:hypothetical protein